MTPTKTQNMPQVGTDTQPLTRDEMDALKKSFEEEGYFIVKNVVSPEKLATLSQHIFEEFERSKATGVLFSGGGTLSGHLNCFPGEESRFIYETLEARGIIDLIKEISPQSNKLPNVGCNLNLPNSVTQHYHTDRDFTREFMIANIALVDTVIENGAMEAAPGTHKKYYKYWQWAIQRPHRNSIRVPMKTGDIMVRTSNMWHRGMPNLTSVPRPMVALTWEDGGSVMEDPWLVDNGKIQFRPNWFRPTRLGRIRESVFVKLPFTYSAYRFVTSLYSNKGY